jgi:ribosomal protein L20
MPRVKRGVTALKRRHKILKQAKGFRFDLGTKERAARTARSRYNVAFAHVMLHPPPAPAPASARCRRLSLNEES